MKVVNVHEAKTHLSRLLERAHGGEEITIAKGGRPYARLVPLAERAPERKSGTLQGRVEMGEGFFDELPPGWTGAG
ncbi:MAG TPA: type II toxin-antitoxin system Phd/YefM family antitoxin [Polyangia bacterium]|nr:type II toxin-antitoxin system Phd/YefM family antitoxin [Polyangia bacterium]